MMRRALLASGLLVAVMLSVGIADDTKEFSAKCPISGRAAKKATAVAYKGGEVYFCCNNCQAAFKKDSKKHAVKANLQLVSTGQAKNAKCPLSGRAAKDGTEVKVGGTAVKFCCNNCKGKVAKAEGDAQLKLVFSDAAFKKGFEVAKKKKD